MTMDSTDILSYDAEADIAMICMEKGRAVNEEHSWGLDRPRSRQGATDGL